MADRRRRASLLVASLGPRRRDAHSAGGRMPRCLPRRSSSRSSAARRSPTRTGSGASRGGSPASARAGADLVVVVSAMGDTTDELLGLAAAITDDPDPRELDMLLATGEHQSATLVSMALHALGVAGDQPDRRRRPASPRTAATAGPGSRTSSRRASARSSSGGKVVIVAGFQGQRATGRRGEPGRRSTTLGRGGSDTTAVALAARLGADRCQIFTDVRGHLHRRPAARPRRPPAAVIGYEEMLELAHQGAQVMQTRAVELGWVNDVVIEVLSSFEDAPGTLIKEDPLVEQRNKVRGLAHDRNVAKVTLVAVPDRPGVARTVFEPLAEAGDQRRHDRPERRPRRRDRPVLHGPAGRARQGEADPRADRPRARRPRDDDRLRRSPRSASSAPASTTRRATRRGCSGPSPTPA